MMKLYLLFFFFSLIRGVRGDDCHVEIKIDGHLYGLLLFRDTTFDFKKLRGKSTSAKRRKFGVFCGM